MFRPGFCLHYNVDLIKSCNELFQTGLTNMDFIDIVNVIDEFEAPVDPVPVNNDVPVHRRVRPCYPDRRFLHDFAFQSFSVCIAFFVKKNFF